MGMWARLRGKEEPAPAVKTAVVGAGPEAMGLASAYAVLADIELVGAETLQEADGQVRMPVVRPGGLDRFEELVRTPGLMAMEIVAPLAERAALARASLQAGLFTSVAPPASRSELDELAAVSRAYKTPLRVRMAPLYYPPYRELHRLAKEDAVGRPFSLKLMTRRGKGTQLPVEYEPVAWINEHELGFLALAQWLVGPIAKVSAVAGKMPVANGPATLIVMWKYRAPHQVGFFQLDHAPDLHVRTFTTPVHRSIELTGLGGLLLATRGEGQLLRQPALIVRGKSTTTAFELIPDDWREVDKELGRETIAVARGKASPVGTVEIASEAFRLVEAAGRSLVKEDEVQMS
jgi:predicted dehydrogenase